MGLSTPRVDRAIAACEAAAEALADLPDLAVPDIDYSFNRLSSPTASDLKREAERLRKVKVHLLAAVVEDETFTLAVDEPV